MRNTLFSLLYLVTTNFETVRTHFRRYVLLWARHEGVPKRSRHLIKSACHIWLCVIIGLSKENATLIPPTTEPVPALRNGAPFNSVEAAQTTRARGSRKGINIALKHPPAVNSAVAGCPANWQNSAWLELRMVFKGIFDSGWSSWNLLYHRGALASHWLGFASRGVKAAARVEFHPPSVGDDGPSELRLTFSSVERVYDVLLCVYLTETPFGM